VRSAQKPTALVKTHPLDKLAHWMLSIFQFMVSSSEQPVRPTKLAQLVDALLQTAPLGITVLAQEEVWTLSQGDSQSLVDAVKTRFDKVKVIS
jgi:hypothetical protein